MSSSRFARISLRSIVAALLLALSFTSVPVAAAQRDELAVESRRSGAARTARETGREAATDRTRYTVLVDLDENRLYFKKGEQTLWSAPVGTGTGMRVITHDDEWDFSTPTGRFEVQYKERDPIWIAPDWYFVENNLPVPAVHDKSRYKRGILGTAAVYISPDVAIHGTDRPELLGDRVSHGCIRLENRYAERLYHNVHVGTQVVIVGGKDARQNARTVDLRSGYDSSLARRGNSTPPPVDATLERWKTMRTPRLLRVLDDELSADRDESRWDQVAVILLNRGWTDDDAALEGLVARAANLPTTAIEREWATYLAYAYRRAPMRTLEAMSEVGLRQRRTAARYIASATMMLYSAELGEGSTRPAATSSIPTGRVTRDAQRGWDALVAAEREYRDDSRLTAGRT